MQSASLSCTALNRAVHEEVFKGNVRFYVPPYAEEHSKDSFKTRDWLIDLFGGFSISPYRQIHDPKRLNLYAIHCSGSKVLLAEDCPSVEYAMALGCLNMVRSRNKADEDKKEEIKDDSSLEDRVRALEAVAHKPVDVPVASILRRLSFLEKQLTPPLNDAE